MEIELRPDEITRVLYKELSSFDGAKSDQYETGTVLSVGDGIARIFGLKNAMAGELISFRDRPQTSGLVLNLENDHIGVALLGDVDEVIEGDIALLTGKVASVKVGEELLGRVVNSLGHPIDGGPAISTQAPERLIEKKAPGIIDRENVSEPLYTGIKSIDAMIPIGRGQRELIIGDRKTGKTTIALDTIINQKGKGVYCIYVAVGQKSTTVVQVYETLRQAGAMEYTTIVSASAAESAPMQYLAPYTGVTLGEYYRDHGKHALVIYDDLTKHAQAYRQMSLLLRRPPGREAFPGDVFYLHSRLLERAAKMSAAMGGGTLTALPIVETQSGDVSAYIPTNVISITDGQIFLDTDLFNSGLRPALDVGLSVSRVGGDAQIKATKQVAGKLKLILAQYREMAAFSQFSSDLDKATQAQLAQGERFTELLKQPQGHHLSIGQIVIILFAAVEGYLDSLPVSAVLPFQQGLFNHISTFDSSLPLAIEKEAKLTPDLIKRLKKAIEEFSNLLQKTDSEKS